MSKLRDEWLKNALPYSCESSVIQIVDLNVAQISPDCSNDTGHNSSPSKIFYCSIKWSYEWKPLKKLASCTPTWWFHCTSFLPARGWLSGRVAYEICAIRHGRDTHTQQWRILVVHDVKFFCVIRARQYITYVCSIITTPHSCTHICEWFFV